MLSKLGQLAQWGVSGERDPRPSWAAVALALAVGCAYFLAARLGLALLTQAEGVAVFWPASGVAAGALIALGRRARASVVIGVIGGTVAANLLGDRNLLAALSFGLCNAGEALLAAWLVERWFGHPFKFDDLYRVWGFLAAATVGAAAAAVGGALAVGLFHTTAPLLDTWRLWATADGLGIVTTAPLLISLYHLASERVPRRELVEGVGALAVLAAMSAVAYASPPGSLASHLPSAVLFLLLLWVAARCRPAFAAAAAFIIASVLVGSVTFGLGRYGDAGKPVLAAQAVMLIATLCALILAALFAERRRNEAALMESNERLRLALSGADLGVWSVDLATGRFESDERHRQINGHDPAVPPRTLGQARTFVHRDDLPPLDAAFATARQTGAACRAEYRVRIAGSSGAASTRWVAVEGTAVRNAAGEPMRLLGVTQDITERKVVEENLRKHERALRDLLGALPAAVYTTDAEGRLTYYNQGAVDLWGAEPELGKDKWCFNCRFYHADGTRMAWEECPTEIALKGRVARGVEAILERADGTRIPIIPYPTPLRDERGAIVGVVNMTVDIGERKKADLALAERNAQLALAGQAGLVGSYAYDISTDIMQTSAGYAAIYGLPVGTSAIKRDIWRAHVHPDDLAQLEARRERAIAKGQREHQCEYRILRSGREIRWIESRSVISYDDAGLARRMVGVNIDVTERKLAEEHKNLLVAELDHRVKNVLAVVAAVVSRTQEASTSMSDFAAALDGRIKSMAATHELLSWRKWQGIPLADLVERELAPHAAGSNVRIEGPEVVLRAEAGQALAMVVHELATNAAKYGALSAQRGRVSVRWKRIGENGSRGTLAFDWFETGGPAVAASPRVGFGTSVIRDLVPYELGGTVELELAPEGVRCRVEIPAAWLSGADRPRSVPAPPPSAERAGTHGVEPTSIG